jgi:hypothetical protein
MNVAHLYGKNYFSEVIKRLGDGVPFAASPLYGDAVGSGGILEAEECLHRGQEIPERLYKFPNYDRKLRPSDSELYAESALDGLLTFLLARGLGTNRDFSVMVYEESEDLHSQGGPWLGVHTSDTHVEVSLMSNYQSLEHKESWYSATLSLFGWTTLPTGGLSGRLYRKVWDSPVDLVDVAAACSLVLLHVFQCLRVPTVAILTTLTHDPIFRALPKEWQIHDGVKDFTLSRRYSEETRSAGMVPNPSLVGLRDESRDSLANIERAEQIAASVDDMVGIETLADVKSRVQRRIGYEAYMDNRVRLALHCLIGIHFYSEPDDESYYD